MSGIDPKEALDRLRAEGPDLYALLARAGAERHARRGDRVGLCSIVNARCGACTEDCGFCAQSVRARSPIESHPLLDPDRIVAAARAAAAGGAGCFGIVTSGRTVAADADLDRICEAVERIAADLPLRVSASLGLLGTEPLRRLRAAGLHRYHHNLETAESFYPSVCTTHAWSESVETIERARAEGLSICCGGLFGLGESPAQRIEFLEAIRRLEPDSVPINFFHPIPGTRMDHLAPLEPFEALKVVAVARLMLPAAEIRVCGGRERVLGDFQSWVFLAGADGLMVGGYLTTPGRPVAADLHWIARAGMVVARPGT